MQAYNAQIAVDEEHQIIVAAALSNQSPDAEYFEPMLRRVVENCSAAPERATADSGYFSADNVRAAKALGVEPFIAPGRLARDNSLNELPDWYQTDERQRMRALLSTERGKAAYARRKSTVEPVFGQIRTRGVRQMSFRGLVKNRLEWLLICATHNLLNLWRSRRLLAAPTAA